jgi:hypothetical protein
VVALLAKVRVRVITFAQHTIEIFQVLDVTLSGLLKPHTSHELPFGDDTATVQFIMKVHHDSKQTMGNSTRWRAFQALVFELEFDTTSEAYRLLFNEEKTREIARFRGL